MSSAARLNTSLVRFEFIDSTAPTAVLKEIISQQERGEGLFCRILESERKR